MSKIIYIKWQDVLNELTATCNRSKFENLFSNQNCQGMVKHCLEDCNIRSLLETWMEHFGIQRDKTLKSVTKSNEYRTSGNNKFKIGKDIESLQLYSKSICFAPKNNEAYSLGFANRSAVLFRLQHYEECLQDIDTALETNYPDHLRYKLLLRKGKIFLIKRQCQKAIKFLKEAESCMPANVQSFVRSDLLETLGAAIANSDLNIEENSINDLDLLPKLKSGENKKLMHSSAALSLKESKEKGRHIIANVDIKKGDVLFVEKPVAFVVLPGSSENVCHHCCKPSHSLIPCEHCVSAVFCSHACYTNAWEKYHQWECGGLELFYLVGIAHLGLRLTFVCSSIEQDERQDQVMNLMSHIEDLQLEDAYQYCLTASLLLLYLQKNTQYFSTVENSDSVYKVGGQILHHICQLICNGHAITGFATTPGINTKISSTEDRDEVSVATAIFPTASMMNHSCDPNIINSFCNEYLIVKAVKDISCGDEVFNCYGPYFRRMDSTERKEVLKRQYFFDCSCLPCQKLGNDDFLAKFSALLCLNCDGPLLPTDLSQGTCLNCGNLQPTEKLMLKAESAKQLFNQGLEKLERNEPADACDLFKEALKIFAESLYRHNIKIRECRDLVAKCLVELSNFSEGGDSLLENLESIEQQYGPDSIEVANELLKYIDVAESEVLTSVNGENGISHISNERLKKINHCIKRAINIYSVNCGVWSENYRSVLKTEETLKNYLLMHV